MGLQAGRSALVRIKIVQTPGPLSIDGIQLSRFEAGNDYIVGNTVGGFLLANGWAVPADGTPGEPSEIRAGRGPTRGRRRRRGTNGFKPGRNR
jgi:hypothetical protein